MIKRLKIKFILINMLFVSIVMLAMFFIMYFNTANDLQNDSISAMRDAANKKPGLHDVPNIPKPPHHPNNLDFQTYSIYYDKRNDTYVFETFGNIKNLNDSEVAEYVSIINSIHAENRTNGILSEYNLRYYLTDSPSGERIILLDMSHEKDSLRRLVISYLTGGSIAFVLFLFISVFLAHVAIKPVEESLTKQSQLIADVSHELKTPITIISTNTDIVISHEDSTVKDEHKWLGYIKDEAQRMSTLVNMMLYLAKTEEVHSKPTPQLFDLGNTVLEMSLPFESICYENSKTLSLNIDTDIFIRADEASIKQLIAILIDNAVKYSNENGIIDISLSRIGDKACVSVFNTGDIIPKENIPYIFDRFYRVEESRTREKGGSGLGLSIAQKIAEENGGSITVSSKPDSGTTFKCTFDLAKQKS